MARSMTAKATGDHAGSWIRTPGALGTHLPIHTNSLNGLEQTGYLAWEHLRLCYRGLQGRSWRPGPLLAPFASISARSRPCRVIVVGHGRTADGRQSAWGYSAGTLHASGCVGILFPGPNEPALT